MISNITNSKGNVICQDFISGKFDKKQAKQIIENDKTEQRAGHPSLWYSVYAGSVYITSLTGVILAKYKL